MAREWQYRQRLDRPRLQRAEQPPDARPVRRRVQPAICAEPARPRHERRRVRLGRWPARRAAIAPDVGRRSGKQGVDLVPENESPVEKA